MIYLNPKSNKIIKAKREFHNGMLDFLFKRIDNIGKITGISKSQAIQIECFFDIKINEIIDEILVGEPARLVQLNESINPLIEISDILKKGIKYVFNYNTFITKAKKRYDAYNLAEALSINTCTYCNRNYTNTVIKNNGRKITRPQFDHYFDKDKFPLLSLSFFNLIPSCSICNSSIKGTLKMNLNDYSHPYVDNNINEFSFSYKYSIKSKSGLRVIIIPPKNLKIKNTLKAFALEEIYNSHTDELLNLLKAKQYFSDKYLSILSKNVLKGVDVSREDLYRIVFGTEPNVDKFVKKPFSKFKKDILKELGVIDDKV